MLRILHSLPRTHKLLLLPVATMVTVLGAHKIMAAFDATDENPTQQMQVNLPIDFETQVAAITSPQAKPAKAIGTSTPSVIDATSQAIPLSKLIVNEVVDLSVIDSAHAAQLHVADKGPFAPSIGKQASEALPADARHLDTQALHLAMQLAEDDEAGGTSYEDLSIDPMILNDDDVDLETELATKESFVPEWETYTVQKGDTFAMMAERTFGLGYSEVMALLDDVPDKRALTNWRVGDNFDFKLDESGNLLALRIMKNARSGYLIERGNENADFDVSDFEKASEATQRLFAGTLSGSFALSASSTGLSNAEVAELTSLLSKKINFRRDARRGDKFQVLVEADMIEGQSMDSRILAVHYNGKKQDLTVVRNPADDRYYTPEGHSLDPAFNRYPFIGHHRISSPFNLRRKHPITGRISPHRGTDFAMRSGTTVKAPADGRVVKAAFQAGGAGNYIVVRHDNGYKTRYMHLSKRLVSEGERVTMGEKIALSGNTGRSTGPHLHYEVMVNNHQVDAMRVKLPESKNLSGQALASFKSESKQLLAKLDSDSNANVVASRSGPSKRPDGI